MKQTQHLTIPYKVKFFCWMVMLSLPLLAVYPLPAYSEESVNAISASEQQDELPPAESNADTADEAPIPLEPSVDEKALESASEGTTSPGNVSLDFKDADILNVLRVLSLKSGVNIVAGPEVHGTVTIRLQDVPWQKALEVVLRTYGYVFEREQNIVRVTTKENLATEELITETYVLNYTTSSEVEAAIKDILSERGRVKSVPRANTVIITDIPTNLYKIGQVIRGLDKITQQVFIDAKIVRTQLDQNEDLGINWNPTGTLTGGARQVTFPWNAPGADNIDSNPLSLLKAFYGGQAANPSLDPNSAPIGTPDLTLASHRPTFTFGTLSFTSFTATLKYLQQKTNTKIISNPRIVVLNNQTAKVQVGDQIPIPSFERNETTGSFEVTGFTYRDIGVVLNVTPHVNQTNEILVDLKPEVSSLGTPVSFGAAFEAPSFTTTTAQTQVLINNGETIAIGGLARDSEKVQDDSVPGLSKIPLMGRLFRRHSRSSASGDNQKVETLFFITVTIVDTQGQPMKKTVSTRTGTTVLNPQKAAPPVL